MGSEQYRCITCKVDYDHMLNMICMFTHIKGKRFALQIWFNDNPFRQYPVDIICLDPGWNQSAVISHLSEIPNITPQNINQKLKTYLTFS